VGSGGVGGVVRSPHMCALGLPQRQQADGGSLSGHLLCKYAYASFAFHVMMPPYGMKGTRIVLPRHCQHMHVLISVRRYGAF
jgi:hypothetical protein